MDALSAFFISLILLGIIAGTIWFFISAEEAKQKQVEALRKLKQEILQQVTEDSLKGESREWNFDETVLTRVADTQGIPKGYQATNIKISKMMVLYDFLNAIIHI